MIPPNPFSPGLELRLVAIEDRLALEDLVADYFIAVDDRDYGALAATLAEDAVWGESTGRVAIVNSQRRAHADMGPGIHHPSFMRFQLMAPDRATGVVGAHCELEIGGQLVVGSMRYLDEYVKRLGAWLIQRRRLDWYFLSPWEDAASALSVENPKRWPGRPPEGVTLPTWRRSQGG